MKRKSAGSTGHGGKMQMKAPSAPKLMRRLGLGAVLSDREEAQRELHQKAAGNRAALRRLLKNHAGRL